ncbi:MAG: hypothetical protein WAO02_12935 [Verrucomicrobiia bacterium]
MPDGQLFGGSISPKGSHIAVFAAEGSHYQFNDRMTFIARTDGNLRRFTVKSNTDLAAVLATAPAVKPN